MASWGTKRRNIIVTLFILIMASSALIIGFLFYYKAPTCFDGIYNGKEQGIDCGGECSLLCSNQSIDPIVNWKRYFNVAPGIYNAIAYVENQNSDAGATNIEYTFKLYDKNNIVLRERTGTINLKPKQVTPIIENNLDTGKLEVARVSFEFNNEIDWKKQEPLDNLVVIKNQEIFEVNGLPRVSAEVRNNTLETLKDLTFVVIIYDSLNNAIATSNTKVFKLEKDASQNIIFTWPNRFETKATRFEIIPIYEFSL